MSYMMTFLKRLMWPIIMLSLLLAVFTVYKAYAVPINTEQCLWYEEGETTPASGLGQPPAIGNGFLYRTLRVKLSVDSSEYDILSGIISLDCDVSNAWDVNGGTVYAVQAELGRKLDAHVGGSLAPPNFCLPETPSYPDSNNDGVADPPVYRCNDAAGDFTIFQDDASVITVNGTTLTCIGIWPCGNIYERGVSPSGRLADNPVTTTRSVNAHRGAGFVNVPRRTIAGNGTSTIGNIPVTLVAANTWSGNYEASVLITLKYRQNPPGACSPSAQTVGVNQTATFTASGTGPFTWSATGGSPSSGSNSGFATSYSTAGTRTVTLTSPSGSVNCTVTVTAPVGCPSLPDPYVRVTLNRTYNDGGPARAGYGSHTQRVTQETRYTSHSDISPGGGRVIPPLVSQTAGNPGNVVLDYGAYIQEYPFDRNQSRVFYNDAYNQYYYTYSGAEVWDRHDVYRWRYYPDPDGTGPRQAEWRYEYWYTYYTFEGYAPVLQSTTRYNENRSVDALLMQPCWQRHYDVDQVTINAPTLTPDRESPNNSSVNGVVNVQFDVDPVARGRGRQDMRIASRVQNVPATVSYRILRSNGSVGGSGTTTNTNLTINAASPNQRARGASVVSGSIVVSAEVGTNPLFVGDRVCWTVRVPSRKTGLVNVDGNAANPSGNISSQEVCSEPMANWPYFEVYGNDVVSGGSFTSGCTNAPGIRSRGRAGQFRGSSTQYAAIALGQINFFTSSSVRNAGANPANGPYGLTISNQVGGFGGNYVGDGSATCFPNYFGSRPTNPAPDASINTFPAIFNHTQTDPSKVQYYEINGDYTFSGGPQIQNGHKKVIYINGTLRINNNIEYRMNPGWTTRDDVPYAMFIARDIIIGSGVTRLDGVYVAQPNGGGAGAISTCDSNNYNACRNELVINGAFIAERVNLLRTRGSHRNSQVNEGRPGVAVGTNGNNRCSAPFGQTQTASLTGTVGGNSCAAEIFSFSPEIYMGLSQIVLPEENFTLDSFVTLPPNL